MLTERRKDVRVPVDLLLNKLIQDLRSSRPCGALRDDAAQIPYTCRASNISRGGMMIHRVSGPLGLLDESEVRLQFQLPGNERLITCTGALVYEHSWLIAHGIRFTSIAPDDTELIARFVSGRVG